MNPENALIIFVRHPEPGKVKTRLAATIGNDKALKIYRELLRHTREITVNLPVRKFLYYADAVPEKDEWPPEIYARFRQPEGDLGRRMEAAFASAFAAQATRVMIIGSDCYELTEDLVAEAFLKLETHDAVIGPAADGGYYLLGFSRPNHSVFRNKTWSTPQVFAQTVADLKQHNLNYFVLPVLNDVDEERDLGALRRFL